MKNGVGEAFRKALVDVLVPEIRELRGEVTSLREDFARMEGKIDILVNLLMRNAQEVPTITLRVENLEKAVEKLTRAA